MNAGVGKLGTIALVGFLTILAGCSGGASGESTGSSAKTSEIVSQDQELAEYRAEAARLDLPGKASWPSPTPLPSAPDANGVMRGNVFEKGVGTSNAQGYFLCAWMKESLSAHSGHDDARLGIAIAKVKSVRSMRLYLQDYDAATRAGFDKEVSRAELGDFTLMRQDVAANC